MLYCLRPTTWTGIFVRVSGGETPPFRPPIPPNDMINDVQFIQLMRDCWDEHPTLRPDFSTIRSRFILINKGKYDKILFIELIVEPKTTNEITHLFRRLWTDILEALPHDVALSTAELVLPDILCVPKT